MNPVERSGSTRQGRTPVALRAVVVMVLALFMGLPFPARAQDEAPGADTQRKAAAEVLFVEGTKLLHEQSYDAACRRFEQSQALDPGVGTLLYLGQCYEGLGRPASAWAIYREAESAANAARQPARAQVALERASQLEPSLARLTVQVGESPPSGFELTINGKRIDAALFGVAFPIDPGRYELVARAFGRTPWSSSIDVQAAQQRSVQVPALDVARDVQALPPTDPYAPAAPAGGIAEASATLSPRQRAAIIVGAGGVTAIAAGVVMGLVAQGKDDDAQQNCRGERCWTPDAAALNESARDWATGANISFIIGGLALATGGALYFWPQKSSAAARSMPLDVSARVGTQGGILTVGGTL